MLDHPVIVYIPLVSLYNVTLYFYIYKYSPPGCFLFTHHSSSSHSFLKALFLSLFLSLYINTVYISLSIYLLFDSPHSRPRPRDCADAFCNPVLLLRLPEDRQKERENALRSNGRPTVGTVEMYTTSRRWQNDVQGSAFTHARLRTQS